MSGASAWLPEPQTPSYDELGDFSESDLSWPRIDPPGRAARSIFSDSKASSSPVRAVHFAVDELHKSFPVPDDVPEFKSWVKSLTGVRVSDDITHIGEDIFTPDQYIVLVNDQLQKVVREKEGARTSAHFLLIELLAFTSDRLFLYLMYRAPDHLQFLSVCCGIPTRIYDKYVRPWTSALVADMDEAPPTNADLLLNDPRALHPVSTLRVGLVDVSIGKHFAGMGGDVKVRWPVYIKSYSDDYTCANVEYLGYVEGIVKSDIDREQWKTDNVPVSDIVAFNTGGNSVLSAANFFLVMKTVEGNSVESNKKRIVEYMMAHCAALFFVHLFSAIRYQVEDDLLGASGQTGEFEAKAEAKVEAENESEDKGEGEEMKIDAP